MVPAVKQNGSQAEPDIHLLPKAPRAIEKIEFVFSAVDRGQPRDMQWRVIWSGLLTFKLRRGTLVLRETSIANRSASIPASIESEASATKQTKIIATGFADN